MIHKQSIWASLDWWTIVLYLLLLVCGWFSVCGASYEFGNPEFLDFSTRADDTFAYLIYVALMLLLLVTIFIAPDTKGSHSWLILGPVSLQPAEFAKFATALALAKYMNAYGFTMRTWKSALGLAFLVLFPMLLIIMQRETGSALVYLAFSLVLYREGMPGVILFAGVCAIVYFVVGIRYGAVMWGDSMPTPVGQYVVLLLIMLAAVGMSWLYLRQWKPKTEKPC